MKPEWGWWGTCVVCVVFGGVLGRAIGGGPTAAERALADSLRAQSVTLSAQAHANDSLRLLLQNASHSVTTAAVSHIAPARLHTDTIVINSVMSVPDNTALHTALNIERAACDTALAASGRETMTAQMATASVQAERDAALRMQVRTQTALDAALRIRRPSRILLGMTGGYGATWSGGRMAVGPSVNLGVTVQIPLPKIL